MKYMADDGTVFTSEQECARYEQDLERDKMLYADAARFLDLQEWPEDEKSKKRERSKAERWIHAWLAYDARQRPERYGSEADWDSVELADERETRSE